MSDQTPAEQWNAAASGWARWAERAGDYIGPATEKMLDLAGVAPGNRALDVGCGSGEQTVLVAHRVGATGHVLAIDIAAPMIAATEKTLAVAGLTNVSTRVCSAEALTDDTLFDTAISRLVLMLIPDPLAAVRAVWTVLRPGGSFAAIVPGNPERDIFASPRWIFWRVMAARRYPLTLPAVFVLSSIRIGFPPCSSQRDSSMSLSVRSPRSVAWTPRRRRPR